MAGAPWWEQFDPGPRDPGSAGEARPAPGTGTLAATGPRVVADDGGNGPAAPPPRPPRGLQVVAAVLALVLVALLGVLAARTVGASSVPAPQEGTAGGPTGAPAPTGEPAAGRTPGGTAAADAAATAELEELRRQGLQAHPPQGQWVAQLAAKSVGTTDPVQTAANGSSTFYAADILAQSREIASGVAGGDVFVLRTTDFGEGLVDKRDNPYWVTLAAGPFGDADDVRTWCASMFATTPADERGNVCLPKQLTPPG